MLNELSREIRTDNAAKGFDPTEGGVGRYLLLCISELCEAQDELRNGRSIVEVYYSTQAGYSTDRMHGDSKPEGFPVEIADAIIRLLDVSAKFNINFEDSNDTDAEDYSDPKYTLDDWLVGVINTISLMNYYEPVKEPDFELYLKRALGSLFLFCEHYKIPVMDIIREKLAFNRTRPPKHGRKF